MFLLLFFYFLKRLTPAIDERPIAAYASVAGSGITFDFSMIFTLSI